MQNDKERSHAKARQGVIDILEYLGEDTNRQGLHETPERFLKSMVAQTVGYSQDPYRVLEKFFEEVAGYKNLIMLQNIHFESMCEHHLAPIVGNATVGYIPNGRVVGLSKLARVVDIFAKRLQIQERLTSEIGLALDEVLRPKGVGVIIRAKHNCLCTRGAYKPNANMTTTYFSGVLDSDSIKRGEFYTAAALPWGNGVHHSQ